MQRIRSRLLSKMRWTSSTHCIGSVRNEHNNNVEQEQTPTQFNSKFLQIMLERGFLKNCTDYEGLDKHLFSTTGSSAYLGFDATANSLHVGSLLQIMILRHLQSSGIRPIVLLGGGTTKVGDPTGKDESRKYLSVETIDHNIRSIANVFEKFIKFGNEPTDAILVNNADWLDKLNYLDFLRDYGRHFTINRLMSYESVKQRMEREQPFSFLEFNYILLQSYDFLEIHRRYGTVLQLGGSDQWGNIISGVDLGRKADKANLFGLTTPLITTFDGRKMGKTEAGAVWLDKTLVSEFEYWQFWRNTADADVIRFLKLFTEVPMSRIRDLELLSGSELNTVKLLLADEATGLLHGKECLPSIHATADALFKAASGGKGGSETTESLDSLDKLQLTVEDITSEKGANILNLLVKTGWVSSKNGARRLIAKGGVRLNGVKVETEHVTVELDAFDTEGRLKLTASKKVHCLLLKP